MNAIGGYFGLELNSDREYHADAIRLNTGRNALEYILIAKRYNKVYLPYYTCDVLLEPIRKLGLNWEFYYINESFEAIFDFSVIQNDECFLYTNYFGIKDDFISELAKKCSNLIVDNAQAFYSQPLQNVDTFYSPRKFFGVPDGAYLYTNKPLDRIFENDISHNRFKHLLLRIDAGAEDGYSFFIENEKSLSNMPILGMSKLTKSILGSLDYARISQIRRENYHYLHNALRKSNRINLEPNLQQVPMVYPFLSSGSGLRSKLTANKIYTPQYWPNVLKLVNTESIEWNFTTNLVHLPIDQRYSREELDKVIKIIFHEHSR